MNIFLKRTLTATAFSSIVLSSTYYNQLSFSILFFIITILGCWEFYTLLEKAGNKPQKLAGTIAAAILFGTNALACMHTENGNLLLEPKFLVINLPILFLIFIIELYLKNYQAFQNIGYTLLGLIYVSLPFTLLNYISTLNQIYNYEIIFGLFFILWTNDSGAYIVGSLIGKNKLFSRISPGKTLEGFIGGAVSAYGVAFIISKYYLSIDSIDWLVIASILIVIGTLGDLVESLLKRSLNVKDSGTILPGHGGILDRFDSLILSSPFIFAYLFYKYH